MRGLEKLHVALILGMMSVSTGCSPTIERRALLGKYVANHGKGLDAIELKHDGSYVYFYRSSSGKEFRNAGRWTFYRQDNAPRITFNDFVFGLGGYGGAKPGYWDVEIERSWRGELRLSLDPDLNYYYLKQNQ